MDPRHAPNYQTVAKPGAAASGAGTGTGSGIATAAKGGSGPGAAPQPILMSGGGGIPPRPAGDFSTLRPGAPKQPPSLSPQLTAQQPVKLSQVALYAPLTATPPPGVMASVNAAVGASAQPTTTNIPVTIKKETRASASKPASTTAKDLPVTHAILQDIKKNLSGANSTGSGGGGGGGGGGGVNTSGGAQIVVTPPSATTTINPNAMHQYSLSQPTAGPLSNAGSGGYSHSHSNSLPLPLPVPHGFGLPVRTARGVGSLWLLLISRSVL